jgi:hypothetical protein
LLGVEGGEGFAGDILRLAAREDCGERIAVHAEAEQADAFQQRHRGFVLV